MNIDLNLMEYFTFSWLDTSLGSIEKYFLVNNFNKFNITKEHNKNITVGFEYNPKIFVSHFVEKNNGIIMLPNLQDGWITLFYRLTSDLKINGYHFKICSNKVPYNCIIYIEKGIKKRICYTLKDGNKWIFYETGTPLYFEEIKNYKNRIKKERLNKEIMLKYCSKLNIIKEKIMEINNEEDNIKIMYKNME